MESFDSTKRNLYEILKDVNSGKIQLPDFQRGWVWDDDCLLSDTSCLSVHLSRSNTMYALAESDQIPTCQNENMCPLTLSMRCASLLRNCINICRLWI